MSYVGQGPGLKTTNIKRYDVGPGNTSPTHALSWTAVSEQTLIITINGVKQQDDAYTIAGSPTTITLTDALMTTDKMEVIGIVDMGVSTYPVDGSVSTSVLGNSSVTTAKIAPDAVTSIEIATDAVGTTEIAANAVGNSEMADDAVGVAELSATGTASATTFLRGDNSWGTVTEYNDAGLQDDIALLGFKVAANGSLAKYNLVDQTVDDFQDATGVNAGSSTGEFRSSDNFYYGGSASSDTAWHTGAQASGASPTGSTFIGNMTSDGGLAGAFNSTNNQVQAACANGGNSAGDPAASWVGIDLGALTTISSTQWNIYGSSDYGFNNQVANGATTHRFEGSNSLTNTSTPANSEWTVIYTTGSINAVPGSNTSTFSASTQYRYLRYVYLTGSGSARLADLSIYGVLNTTVEGGNMTLISTTTAAQAAPTKGDIVFTYTNGAGTTTLGTDVTAEISADGGSTWTAMTLGSEGSTGSHNIATAHDVTITSTITAPWNMAYRIKTLNQTAAKTTRIQAVSLGWS